MGNIIVSEFITLDGVIEGPEWSIPFFNEEIGKFKKALSNGVVALIYLPAAETPQ